jgi:AraC family transcriptional regulator, transcriptional activator of pobA
MDEARRLWYFSTMARIRTTGGAALTRAKVPRIGFNRTKYGRDLLIDVAWVHDIPTFILDAPHALGFFDIILVTRGRGSFRLDSHRHAVRPGTVLFTTPGQIREWDVENFDGICLFFEDMFVKEFLQDAAFLHRLPYFGADPRLAGMKLTPTAARRLRARLTTMRRELAHYRRDSMDLLRAQLHEVLLVLAREYAAAHRVAPQRHTHSVVTRYLELVERDAARRHRVADYATELAVSPGHLSVLCTQHAGQQAKQLLHDALVTRARRMLLYTDESAARIATALGFEDPSYFSRFFRRETGRTPREFRSASTIAAR